MQELLNYLFVGLGVGAVYSLVALPMSLIAATTGIVDIGVGIYATVGGLTAATLGGATGFLLGAGAGLGIAMATGALYILASRRGRGGTDLLMIVGLVLLLMATAAFGQVFGLNPRVGDPISGAYRILDISLPLSVLVALLATAGLLGVSVALLNKTAIGRNMRSVASNPTGAALVGINATRYQFIAFASGGLVASIAGMLIITRAGISYDTALNLALAGFGAYIILGIKGPLRAVLGGLVIGTLQTFSIAYAPEVIASSIPLLAILVILASGRFESSVVGARA